MDPCHQVWAINKIMPQNETICATHTKHRYNVSPSTPTSHPLSDARCVSSPQDLVAILNDEGCGDCRRQKQSFQSDSVGGVCLSSLEATFCLSVPRSLCCFVGHRWKLIVFALLRYNVSKWIVRSQGIRGNKHPACKQFPFIIPLCHKIGRFT